MIHDRAAGIDVGARFHVVAIPAHLSEEPVQTFQAFTADLQQMADWLCEKGHRDRGDGIYGSLLGSRL